MKKCTKCGKAKKESQYYKNPKTSDGLRSECKDCSMAGTTAYRRRFANKDSDEAELLFREVLNLTETLSHKIAELESVCKRRKLK